MRDPESGLAVAERRATASTTRSLGGGRRWAPPADRQPEEVAGDIDALEDLGVRHLMLNFQSAELAQTLERMERFTRDVRPLVAG